MRLAFVFHIAMLTRAWLVRAFAVLAAFSAGVLLLRSMAPLQAPTVLAYSGLTVILFGGACLIRPLKFAGVAGRGEAAFAVLAGVVVLAAALLWPVEKHRSTGSTQLDALLPEYDFGEVHVIAIHSTPDRVMRAVRQITFADIRTLRTLGRIRSAAMGHFSEPAAPVSEAAIVDLIARGATGFFPLASTEREYVFGLAGQPWNNAARPVRLTPETFRAWHAAGHIKVAANFRVEDLGNGWSKLSTETRVLATDDEARRTMARYWRLIYPGSGLIRKSMLAAVRERVE